MLSLIARTMVARPCATQRERKRIELAPPQPSMHVSISISAPPENFGMTFAKNRTFSSAKSTETEINQHLGKTLATHINSKSYKHTCMHIYPPTSRSTITEKRSRPRELTETREINRRAFPRYLTYICINQVGLTHFHRSKNGVSEVGRSWETTKSERVVGERRGKGKRYLVQFTSGAPAHGAPQGTTCPFVVGPSRKSVAHRGLVHHW